MFFFPHFPQKQLNIKLNWRNFNLSEISKIYLLNFHRRYPLNKNVTYFTSTVFLKPVNYSIHEIWASKKD